MIDTNLSSEINSTAPAGASGRPDRTRPRAVFRGTKQKA